MTVLAPTTSWRCYHIILKYQILKFSGCVCVSAYMYVLVNRKPPDLYTYGTSGQDAPPTLQDNCVTLGRYSLALYFKVIIWTIVDLNGHNDCALHTFSGFLFYPTLLIWRSLGVVFPSISVQCYGTYKIMFLSWIFFSSQHTPFLNKHTYKSFSFSLSKFNWARDSHVRVKTDSLFLLYQPLPNL